MIEMILLILMGGGATLYLYMSYHYNYWRRKGLPQPPTVFGFGNIFDAVLMKRNTGLIFHDIYNSYPNNAAVGVYGFFTPKLLLRSPELLKKVTATEFSSFHDNEFNVDKKNDPYFATDPFVIRGDEWKPARSKLVAALTPARMKEIFPLMKEVVQRLDAYLNENMGKNIEAKELATLFTMDNVSDTVFGITSNCFTDSDAPFRKFGDLLMKDQLQVWWKTMLLVLMPTIRDLLGYKFMPKSVCDYLENVVHGIMDYRQKNNVSRNDLFQYFLKKESGNFTELMNYAMTFFIEGFETASMVASTVIYELALNQEIQENLYEEVKSMYEENSSPDYETFMNLPYLDKIVQEAQRKYPVLYMLSRICTKSCTLEIDGKPTEIEIGTPVLVPVFSIHRDPQYYPDPEVFDPERFSDGSKAARPQYTYLPFGEGPRICPGQRFGLIQVKLLISNIVYKYRILVSEKTPPKMTYKASSFLVIPNEQLWVRFEGRK